MRRVRILLVFALSCLVASAAVAQQMPNPADMAGRPLPAPELPNGTVSVRLVRERMGNNIANHPVSMSVGGQTRSATTDAQGRATFTGVAPGTPVTVQAVVDGETLTSQQFPVPATGGVRVALIAGIAAADARERAASEAAAQQPARPGVVVFGGESRIIIEFQDDNLQVFYLLDILNNARTPIDTGQPLILELPEGAQGAGAMGGSSSLAMVQNERVRITGPFPPGTTSVQFGFRLPYRGDSVTLSQQWPAAFEQLFVAAEKVGELKITSPQFAQQQEAQAAGQPFLMATGGRLNAGDTLTVTLTGLPHHSTMLRDVGVGLGLLILVIGLWVGIFSTNSDKAATTELVQRKEKLLADLVQLENLRRAARIDERKYATRRQTLMAQLEKVMGELDRVPSGGGEDVAA
jgi:hypothetical protein